MYDDDRFSLESNASISESKNLFFHDIIYMWVLQDTSRRCFQARREHHSLQLRCECKGRWLSWRQPCPPGIMANSGPSSENFELMSGFDFKLQPRQGLGTFKSMSKLQSVSSLSARKEPKCTIRNTNWRRQTKHKLQPASKVYPL